MRLIATVFTFFIVCSALSAQDADTNVRLRFGAFAGGNANFHAASFGSIAGFPSCCPQYTSGAGLTPAAAVFVEIPLSNILSHMVRVTLSDMSGRMSSVETVPVIVSHRLTDAKIQHTLEANIKGIGIEPLVHFRLSDAIGVFTGLRCEFSLKGTIDQREELVAPDVGTFENGSRIRNTQSGNIFALQPIVVSAIGGLRVELPMNKDASVLFIPELSFGFGLNTVTGSEEWRVHSLRLGASLAFQSPKQRGTRSRDVENLIVKSDVAATPFDGIREIPGQSIRFEESEHIDIQPLLPYIFFDANSEALPYRYASTVEGDIDYFDAESATQSTALATYYRILTIVGSRLRKNPSESITLCGVVDSSEERASDIARRRAENIGRYLQKVWRIDRSRIHTTTRPIASAATEEARTKSAELHRVEISASLKILAPMQHRDTTLALQPRYLRIRPQASGTDVSEHWEINLWQKNRLLKSYSGSGAPPVKLTTDLQEETRDLGSDSIVALCIINGRSGAASSSTASVAVERRSLDRKHVEHLPDTLEVASSFLVGIGVDDDGIRKAQLSALRSLLPEVLTAQIQDYSGTSGREASSLVSSLSLRPDRTNIVNPDASLYSATFPENRFYNRCVRVLMRSPR